jgi:hypothetical protein
MRTTSAAKHATVLAALGLTARSALRASRILLVYLNGAGLAVAGWAVDPEPVAREHVTALVRPLLRSTLRKQLTADVHAGLDGLIEMVLRS